MDPLSQALIGSTLAGSFAKKQKVRIAALCGALGGMAPDLDVLIRSTDDPLMRIEFHRHFTHSLAFVPIGGLMVAALLWLLFFRKTQSFKSIYIFTTLGYLTHGLLDSLTSYGTRLLWPFSDLRISWNTISIIDPIYTSILILGVIIAIWRKSALAMILALFLSSSYIGYGFYKHHQVSEIVEEIARARGHKVERMLLNPTIGNNILWRSVYQSGEKYYVDAVRVGVLSAPQIREGEAVDVIDVAELYPTLAADSTQRKDIERFEYFSQGYVYEHPELENVLGDLRYGNFPYDTKSLWGIEVNPQTPEEHVQWKSLRNFEKSHYDEFWTMLMKGFKPSEYINR